MISSTAVRSSVIDHHCLPSSSLPLNHRWSTLCFIPSLGLQRPPTSSIPCRFRLLQLLIFHLDAPTHSSPLSTRRLRPSHQTPVPNVRPLPPTRAKVIKHEASPISSTNPRSLSICHQSRRQVKLYTSFEPRPLRDLCLGLHTGMLPSSIIPSFRVPLQGVLLCTVATPMCPSRSAFRIPPSRTPSIGRFCGWSSDLTRGGGRKIKVALRSRCMYV